MSEKNITQGRGCSPWKGSVPEEVARGLVLRVSGWKEEPGQVQGMCGRNDKEARGLAGVILRRALVLIF